MKHEVIENPSTYNVLRMMFECRTFDEKNDEKASFFTQIWQKGWRTAVYAWENPVWLLVFAAVCLETVAFLASWWKVRGA